MPMIWTTVMRLKLARNARPSMSSSWFDLLIFTVGFCPTTWVMMVVMMTFMPVTSEAT